MHLQRNIALFFLLLIAPLKAAVVTVAPSAMHIELYDCTEWSHTRELYGARVEGCFPWEGYCIKPHLVGGWGGGDYYRVAIAVGRYFSVANNWGITPFTSYSYSYLKSSLNFPSMAVKDIKQAFSTHTSSFGVELTFCFMERWQILGALSYGFSLLTLRTQRLPNCRFNTSGLQGELRVERIASCYTLHLALSYDGRLYDDRQGFIVKVVQAGLGYRF